MLSVGLHRAIIFMVFAGGLIEGCQCPSIVENGTLISVPQDQDTSTLVAEAVVNQISGYEFTQSVNVQNRLLFYLHGKIIEDQGIPARSAKFGEYEYLAILEKLAEHGFTAISEQRVKDTDSFCYAQRVTGQIKDLLKAGVQAANITVGGASKGAGIAFDVSSLLENTDTHFVATAICNSDVLSEIEKNQIELYGKFLSIYDASEPYAASCQDLFASLMGVGVLYYDEIVLDLEIGHGMLYKPLDD